MTKEELKGLVIYMNEMKSLIQTKRIRICQREKLVDKMFFLIPKMYNYENLENYTILLLYRGSDLTTKSSILERLSDGQGGYEDYEDANGNKEYMIYHVNIDCDITRQAGDVTLSLSLQYVDYEAQTTSNDDNLESAETGEPIQHVINTDTTIINVLPITDYYAIIPDDRLSFINQSIEKLDAQQKELEATANIIKETKADGIEMYVDQYRQCLRLTSNGKPVGNEIDLSALGDEISEWSQNGLVKVITEDEPEPGPTPSDEYANDIVLVINEQTQAIYLTHNGHIVGTPIDLSDLGEALADWNEEGLVKVITDDNSVITDDNS